MARGRPRGSATVRGARGGASTSSRTSTTAEEEVIMTNLAATTTSTRRTSSRTSKATTSAAAAAVVMPSTSRGRGGRKSSVATTTTNNNAATAAVDEVNASMFYNLTDDLLIEDSLPPPIPNLQLSKGKGNSNYLKDLMSGKDLATPPPLPMPLPPPSSPPKAPQSQDLLFTNGLKELQAQAPTSSRTCFVTASSKPSTSTAAAIFGVAAKTSEFKTPSSIRARLPLRSKSAAEAEAAAAKGAPAATQPQPQQSSSAPVKSASQMLASSIFNKYNFDDASPIRDLRNNYLRRAPDDETMEEDDDDDDGGGGDLSLQALKEEEEAMEENSTIAVEGQPSDMADGQGAAQSTTQPAAASADEDNFIEELRHFDWSTGGSKGNNNRAQAAAAASTSTSSHRDTLKRVDLRPRFEEESLSTMELTSEGSPPAPAAAAAAPVPTSALSIVRGGQSSQQQQLQKPFTTPTSISLPTSMDGFSRQLAARASARQQQQRPPLQSTPLVPRCRGAPVASLAGSVANLQLSPTVPDKVAVVAPSKTATAAAILFDDSDLEGLSEDLMIEDENMELGNAAPAVVNRSSTPPPPPPPLPAAKIEEDQRGPAQSTAAANEQGKSAADDEVFDFDDMEDFEAFGSVVVAEPIPPPPPPPPSTTATTTSTKPVPFAPSTTEAAAAAETTNFSQEELLLDDDFDDFEALEDEEVAPMREVKKEAEKTEVKKEDVKPKEEGEKEEEANLEENQLRKEEEENQAAAASAEVFDLDDLDDDEDFKALWPTLAPSTSAAATAVAKDEDEFTFEDIDDDFELIAIPAAATTAAPVTITTTTTNTAAAAALTAEDIDEFDSLLDDDLDLENLPMVSTVSLGAAAAAVQRPIEPSPLPEPERLMLRRLKRRRTDDLFGENLTTLNEVRAMLRQSGCFPITPDDPPYVEEEDAEAVAAKKRAIGDLRKPPPF